MTQFFLDVVALNSNSGYASEWLCVWVSHIISPFPFTILGIEAGKHLGPKSSSPVVLRMS